MNCFEASFTLTGEKARVIVESLNPELATVEHERSRTKVISKGDKLELRIESPDLHALRAAINTYLKWIIMASDLAE